MWPYPWTHVGTPSHLGHMDRVAATMPSQAHAGAAQEAPDIGQLKGQDVPLVRPSSCNVTGGIPSSRRYLPTYLPIRETKVEVTKDELSKLMSVGTELAKEIQEIKRNWVPKSDDKSKENKENNKNKDKDKKGKKGGKKKDVNEVDAEESTPTTTTDAP